MNSDGSAARPRLVQRLRDVLLDVLDTGNWKQIEENHRKVGLPWRRDLEPGWGRPKYVKRVLDDQPDEKVVEVARRALECLDRCLVLDVENALFWIDADGIAHVSEVTRLELARALDGRRLHPVEDPHNVLGQFARLVDTIEVYGGVFGRIVTVPPAPTTAPSLLALLDAYRFRDWPDARLFRFLEFLVHPTVRRGDEQTTLVQLLNSILAADRFELRAIEQLSGHPVFKMMRVAVGVAGRPKNLIFASTGPKPEIGFADAVNNDIVILRHAEHCLVYDEPIGADGLRWTKLVEWWAARDGLDPKDAATRRQLGKRLSRSLASKPERRLFHAYFKILHPALGDALPALVPQVYLHYDPMTLRELRKRGDGRRFDVQRMDFLLLLPHGVRVIIEVDGQQHYSTGTEASARPSPEEYARTVRSDRDLRLAGYEVYRFGGYEFRDENSSASIVDAFFTRLFRRHELRDGASPSR